MVSGYGWPETPRDQLISLHRRGNFMRAKAFNDFARVRAAAILLAASAACWTVAAQAQTGPDTTTLTARVPGHAKIGNWGVDLAGRDLAVKPGDDFDHYASGTWFAKTEIGGDKPEVSSFYNLYDDSQEQLKNLITDAPEGSKTGALYKSM